MLKEKTKKEIKKAEKPRSTMKTVFLIVLIFLTIIIIAGIIYVYFSLKTSGAEKQEIPNPLEGLSEQEIETLVIKPIHITYILNEMGFYKIHNPPLSSDVPKIEINVGGTIFNSKVAKGIISTFESSSDNPDLRIITTREEVINAIKKPEENYMIDSAKSGKTQIEMIASKQTLFSKGYIAIYEELTGDSIELD